MTSKCNEGNRYVTGKCKFTSTRHLTFHFLFSYPELLRQQHSSRHHNPLVVIVINYNNMKYLPGVLLIIDDGSARSPLVVLCNDFVQWDIVTAKQYIV